MAENGLTTVQVAVRIRPLVPTEELNGCQKILETVPNEQQVIVKSNDKAFSYNYVFDADVDQETVYNQAVKNMLTNFFKGYNVTILAYGQTGSGKTHTMGTSYSGNEEMGVIPRAVNDIFKEIDDKVRTNIRVTVSFMELYQESIYDLLAERPRDQCIVDIREEGKMVKIPSLTETEVTSVKECLDCLIRGSQGRATGATAMNAHSSRSHAIFTICVTQHDENLENSGITSKFHLVDLAGSERSKKTKATGERFKEGVKINQGLLALGNVISALGDENQKAGYICYRDSKLTRLLQDSLGGNSITLMIACVSPADYNLDETMSTLRYADRALKIKNKPIVNQDPRTAEINRLNQLVRSLQLRLFEQGGPMVDNTKEVNQLQAENSLLMEKNRKLTEQLQLALIENTRMFERALIMENAKDKLQQKLNELKEECDGTFTKLNLTDEQIPLYKMIQNKINDVEVQAQQADSDLILHDANSNNNPPDIVHDSVIYSDISANFDLKQEKHTMEQVAISNQLKELCQEIALKEQLASQIVANSKNVIDLVTLQETEAKVQALEKEKDELLQQLKSAHVNTNSTKLSESRRQRVQELELQINDLNRKVREQARLIKNKEKDDLKIKQLVNEIQSMKQAKVKLVKMLRSEADKFRQWAAVREKEVMRLKDQDRKRQNQMLRMENMHTKQQNVWKRKVAEATAVNKRLKDALAVQKAAQERRGQTQGKAEQRIQTWIEQDLNLIVSTVEAQRSLDLLIEERKNDNVHLKELEGVERTDEIARNIEDLQAKIEITSAQIADMKQKLIDAEQENKSKTRWDMIVTMVEAKCALKYLFELAVELKRKEVYSNLQEQEELEDLREKLADIEKKHFDQIAELEKDNEAKINILLQQLHEGEGDSDKLASLARCFIPSHLEEIAALKSEIETYKLRCTEQEEKLQTLDHNKPRKIKAPRRSELFAPKIAEVLDSTFEIENDDSLNDPDWSKTPIAKKLNRTRINSTYVPNALQTGMKRGSGGSIRCSCTKSKCKTSICGCKKFGTACSKECKCSDCCNQKIEHDENSEVTSSGVDETECDDSLIKKIKRPEPLKSYNHNTTFSISSSSSKDLL